MVYSENFWISLEYIETILLFKKDFGKIIEKICENQILFKRFPFGDAKTGTT